MKNFLFAILLVISSLGCKAQAYSYIPFPTSGMVWNGQIEEGGFGNVGFIDWTYNMGGDTLINNQSYHKIYYLQPPPQLCLFFREDSAKRIYFISVGDTLATERPLYDFSLNAGDTLFSDYGFFSVTTVDTPSYFGIPRRTLHIQPCCNYYPYSPDMWIEGLGSSVGPIGSLGYTPGGPIGDWLCNITLNNSVAYASSSCHEVGISELSNTSISYSPNPASSTLNINLPDAESRNLHVYNALGQLQLQKNSIAGDQTTTLDINALADGLYFLQVTNQFGGVNMVRFIKMK